MLSESDRADSSGLLENKENEGEKQNEYPDEIKSLILVDSSPKSEKSSNRQWGSSNADDTDVSTESGRRRRRRGGRKEAVPARQRGSDVESEDRSAVLDTTAEETKQTPCRTNGYDDDKLQWIKSVSTGVEEECS